MYTFDFRLDKIIPVDVSTYLFDSFADEEYCSLLCDDVFQYPNGHICELREAKYDGHPEDPKSPYRYTGRIIYARVLSSIRPRSTSQVVVTLKPIFAFFRDFPDPNREN